MLIYSSVIAQESQHYPLNPHDFPNNMNLIAKICINGVEQTSNAIEIGAFNGNTVTGSKRIQEYGSNHYFRINMLVYGNSNNYEVTFKLYNHDTGDELSNCIVTFEGNPYTVTWESDATHGKYKNPVVLNFVTEQSFTKPITGYGTGTGKWYLISSPLVNDFTPNDVMTSNTYDLYRFNQSADLEWENWKAEGSHNHFDLESGKGYLYANSQDVELTFTGTPYSGNGQVTLVKDNNAKFAGWNLVGNPFAQTAYLNRDFYVMNEAGTGIIASEGNSIEAMEGVFVIAATNGETMTFSTDAPQQGNNPALVMNVTHNRGAAIDRAIIRFGKESVLPKFMLDPNQSKLYIQQDGKDYAVVHAESLGEMPVSFEAEKDGSYTISINAEDVDFSYLHLIDNKTGTDINLLEIPSYTFEARTTDYASRFRLIFSTGSDGTEDAFAFFSNGSFVINNEGNATLQVVDVTGRIICSESINGSANVNVNASPGVYVLRLINGDSLKIQKVVIG